MPLNCDCYGGCWGDHSKDWPSIIIPPELIEKEKSNNCQYPDMAVVKKLCVDVSYGSYVVIGKFLRLETQIDLDKVTEQIKDLINATS